MRRARSVVRPGPSRRLAAAAAVALAAFVQAVAATAHSPAPPSAPPGIPPSRIVPSQRPPVSLAAALRAVTEPAAIVVERQRPPAPGSAGESEAVRRYVRGRQHMLDGQFLRAADDFDGALRLDADSTALRSARAEAAGAVGDLRRALAEWEAVLARDPSDVQALVAVGMASFENGQSGRAATLLGRAWPVLEAGRFEAISDAGRAAIGGALARSLFRLGFDEAGLEVAAIALEAPVEQVAAQRGDGRDAAERSAAALSFEAGEAALRGGRPEAAFAMFARSHLHLPDVRAVALAAYSQLLAGDAEGARASLAVLLSDAPWRDAERTAYAEWLLRALGGDPASRETLTLAALSADQAFARTAAAPAEVRGRIARLMDAAGDVDGSAAELAAAVADGACDPLALELAFRRAGDAGAPAAAVAMVRSRPERLREACRAMVRASRDIRALRAAVEALPPGGAREAVAAGMLATVRASGEAWRRAEAAADEDPSRLPLEAMLLAAVSAADPGLVARAASAAPLALEDDAAWHASVARAFAETGASFDAEQSLARAELLAGSGTREPEAERAIAQARSLVDGRAPEGSARARAEVAIAGGDGAGATAELLLAREADPDDAAALGMLMRVLPRTEGPDATDRWLEAQLAAHPNEPVLWEATVLHAIASGRAAAALARIDARLAADPDDSLVLPGREALLRAAGRAADAAAAAHGRIASLPSGPRRSLEEADLALQSGAPDAAVEALGRFEESAYPPPTSMRAAALDLARRIPPATAGRSAAIRRIARDAILTNPRASLEFYAFDALGAASAPGATPQAVIASVAAIAAEAAAVPDLRLPVESWRASADFLLAQRLPLAAAEFVRARLEDPSDAPAEDVATLAQVAIACDALARGRAAESVALVNHLAGLGVRPFDVPGRPAAPYEALSATYVMLGDRDGSELIQEAGLAVDPDDAGLLNNLGYARTERGVTDAETESMLERAARQRPSDPGTLDSLGRLRYRQGRLADSATGPGAVTLLRRAVTGAGASAGAELHDHFGDALWASGDRDGARRQWAQAQRRAEDGLTRDRHVELLRQAFRKRLGLSAIDAARYYDDNDGAVAARAKAKLEAAERGEEPRIAPSAPAPAPAAKAP